MNLNRLCFAFAAACAFGATSAQAATDIQFWHSMSGAPGERLTDIVSKFNDSQKEYKIVPVFKGSYEESMAAGLAAVRSRNAPHILQVFEVGSAEMMAAKKAIKPVYQVMAEAHEKFDPRDYIPSVAGYYTDNQGKMLSMPFNSSTAVFYYNKDAFRKAGIDPETAPKSWYQVQEAALKLKDTGATACGFTTCWQSWVQLENMSALHNQEFATRNNGFGGIDARLVFSNELMIRHISLLSSWVKSELFTYAGRHNEGEAKFASGECGMLTGSSSAYANIVKNAKFQFAVAPLPYYDNFKGAPFNSIIGGASLWVTAGKKPAEYKGVAKFFTFVSKPDIQTAWHQQTGYLPITSAAYALARQEGFYAKHPGTEAPVMQMGRKIKSHSKGVRLGNLVQIRAIIDEELEAVWEQKKSPKQALDDAVLRGNAELRKFEYEHKEQKEQKEQKGKKGR